MPIPFLIPLISSVSADRRDPHENSSGPSVSRSLRRSRSPAVAPASTIPSITFAANSAARFFARRLDIDLSWRPLKRDLDQPAPSEVWPKLITGRKAFGCAGFRFDCAS